MYYYIINSKIIGYENELDAELYDYPKLTEGQKTFYEANPKVTLSEVLAMQLNEPTSSEIFFRAKETKKSEWQSKLEEGYLSSALNLTMSLSNSIIDNEDVFLKAQKLEFVLKNSVIPQLQSAGMTEQMINDYEIDIRDKDGVKYKRSISQSLDYIAEMTKIGLKINEVNGLLFDAETQADLDAIDISFNWNTII